MAQRDDDDPSDERFLLVSDNGLIMTYPLGIHLYHIPTPGVADDDFDLVPVWSWTASWGVSSGFRGTLYKAAPHPALWLQGEQATHTLESDVDESNFPVVVNHHITEGRPAYHVGDHLKLKGRKVMGVDVGQHGETVFRTGVLGKPDLTRQLRAKLPGVYDGPWHEQDEVKYVDPDEATGRTMIVIGTVPGRRQNNIPFARRLCLADLPI